MNETTTKTSDVLLIWQAPSRPFKKRDRSYFQTIAGLVFLIVMILFFVKEWLLIGVVLALVFVSYVLASVEPVKLTYKITTKGLWVGELFYKFSDLTEYWFEESLNYHVLVVISPIHAPGKLNIVLGDVNHEKVDGVLREKLIFREKPLKSVVDSMGDWLKQKVPLEEASPKI